MKTLLWKECRENLKWVPLPTLLILVPVAGLLGLQSVLDVGLSLYVSIIAALFGALLGFLQVSPEARGDRRALLLHRPLSPTQIFLGKAVAGLALYLVALGVPVGLLLGMAAAPGYVAKPFDGPMAFPLNADVLTGVVYYFAGMLAAQRDARWYGSKCLGLVGAFWCSILVWTLPEFWQTLLAIVVVGGCAAVAAWGSFVTGGTYASQPWPARVALATTFLMGLCTLSFLGKYYLCRWLEPHNNYSFGLDRQGHVLTVHFTDSELRVTDLQGRTPKELEGVRQDDFHALEEMSAPYVVGARTRVCSYRSWNRFHIEHRNETRPANEDWFFVPSQGRLRGYDRQTKRFVGSFGPAGFVSPGRQPEGRFEGMPYHTSSFPKANTPEYLAFPGAVYRIDFGKRTVQTLFVPPAGETVLWTDRWEVDRRKEPLAFVGTDRSLHVLHENGSTVLAAALAPELKDYRVARVGRLEEPTRYWVWYEPMCYLPLGDLETMPAYLAEYDAAGREIARTTVPPRPGGAHPTGPREPFNEPSFTPALAGLVSPPAEAAVLIATTQSLVAGVRANRDTEKGLLLPFLLFTTQFFIPGVRWLPSAHGWLVFGYAALMAFSAGACALGCYLLVRRFRFSRASRVGWALVGLLFGWVGLVLMLALHERPARVACPGCRKHRVVTRDSCEHCGAGHAVPATDGTEILEPCAEASPLHLIAR